MKDIALRISIGVIAAALIILFAFTARKNEQSQGQEILPAIATASSISIPDSATFAGESLPLKYFYVKEHLDRELTVNTYWHSSTILLLKRAHRWLPVIEPILKANGVPDDFKYVAMIESNLTNVVSPSGAAGFWQFLDGTAKEFGLVVNKEIDERYHLVKATEAACRYLKEAREKYGSWTMAAVAFNAGMNRVNSVVSKQGSINYYDLNLSEETARYVYRAVAIKMISSEPEKYGFMIPEGDLYPSIPYEEVTVDSTINDLAAFAYSHGINYRLLKELNPWLIDSKLTVVSPSKYIIKIARI